MQKVQGIVAKLKLKRSTPARSGDAIKVLSIWRTRKEGVLLVLKKGGDVSAFRTELDRVVEERAETSNLVSTRTLEIRDLDETFEKEEVVSALCLALGRPALHGSCRLFTRFGQDRVGCVPHP